MFRRLILTSLAGLAAALAGPAFAAAPRQEWFRAEVRPRTANHGGPRRLLLPTLKPGSSVA